MPAWMVWALLGLNLVQSIGWGITIQKSMERGMRMYDLGVKHGSKKKRR